jgi:very-short-patch-repair endonuclease
MSQDIAERILEQLKAKPRQLAREIAQALGVDKQEINSVLYGKLRGTVEQDKNYRWSVRSGQKPGAAAQAPKLDTPLAKLSRYYLDCISFDDEGGVSLFAASKFEPTYVELPLLPLLEGVSLGDVLGVSEAQRLLFSIRNDKKRMSPAIGYPCCLKTIRSRSGWEGSMVEPVFVFPLTSAEGAGGGPLVLDVEGVSINFALVARLTGSAGMDAGMELMSELGLGEGLAVEWDEVLERLRNIKSDWPWVETINPTALPKEPSLSVATELGLYNRAILFGREQSIYTVGLEKELTKLQSVQEGAYAGTAIGRWLSDQASGSPPKSEPLLEVIPLNTEQREAVRKGLTAPLTVITGPPGTGKSQVVTSLLLNAAWLGKKVLFASKNNKAVDVVETRVNALGPRPILLRLGADKVRAELAEYLLGLLSAVTTSADQSSYRENLELHQRLLREIAELERKAEAIVALRNKVDELERAVEPVRSELGVALFGACRAVSLLEAGAAHKSITLAVQNATREKQPMLTRLAWSFVRTNRWQAVQEVADGYRLLLGSVGLTLPTKEEAQDAHLPAWEQAITRCQQRVGHIRKTQDYIEALTQLTGSEELPAIHRRIHQLEEESIDLCDRLWRGWLSLQPSKLSPGDRRLLGDYAALLQLIVQANESGGQLGRDVFARYHKLFPSITGLLPCWAVTSLSANGRIPLEPGFFDLVVIDEASQCDIASAIPLLFRAKAAVIIGDPKQLRHISGLSPKRDREFLSKHALVDSHAAWAYSATSLFDLASQLAAGEQVTVLRDHHRCHHDIIGFSNNEFYEGRLRVATRQKLLRPLSAKETGIRWIEVEGRARQATGGGAVNPDEAIAVVQEIRRIVSAQRYQGTLGVVTPFRAQANLIREMVTKDDALSRDLVNADFLAETAHRFQGDERDVMIFSPVVSAGMPEGSIGFLAKTPNLFNVAITRARACLIVVGSRAGVGHSGIGYFEAFVRYFDGLGSRIKADTHPPAELGPRYPKVARPELVSDWERYFYERMYAAGLRPIPQYDVENYTLDFALLDGERRLNIEVDGERYHRSWNGELLLRDRLRNHRMIELGWDVKRFWVYQIRDETDLCIRRVREWMDSGGAAHSGE